MFTISEARDGAYAPAALADAPITVTMRANRSSLSDEARTTLTALIGLAMAAAILPALRGHYLVPVYVLATMAFLVGALEWHKRSVVAEEHLALDAKAAVLTTSDGIATALPRATTELVEVAGPSRLTLFLRSHWGSVEIARCLSLEGKRELAPLLSHALRNNGRTMA